MLVLLYPVNAVYLKSVRSVELKITTIMPVLNPLSLQIKQWYSTA